MASELAELLPDLADDRFEWSSPVAGCFRLHGEASRMILREETDERAGWSLYVGNIPKAWGSVEFDDLDTFLDAWLQDDAALADGDESWPGEAEGFDPPEEYDGDDDDDDDDDDDSEADRW